MPGQVEYLAEPQLVNTGDVDNPVPIGQAILNGYAPGNELYTYPEYPHISQAELTDLQGTSYANIFYDVTKRLLGSALPDEVLRETAAAAYAPQNFDLGEDRNLRFTTLPSGIHIVGLSDGPTGAFKDMAMQPVARWMTHLQKQNGNPLTIMVSTSGDTGPGALEGFGGLENTEIICMFPKVGVSGLQRAQMAKTSTRQGTHVLEVDGDFSYINDLHMEADRAFDVSTVNSVNIARIIAQVPYYFASYLKAIETENLTVGDPVDVSVPSGNFGNGLSAIIARKMGLPLRNIIIATNENNTLDTLFNERILDKRESLINTDSSAQDIRMPSNVWRYFAMLYGNDPEKISTLYNYFNNFGRVAIDRLGIIDESVITDVYATRIAAWERSATIRSVYGHSQGSVMLDPHTANGVAAIHKLDLDDPGVPMLSMETAKPFKFNETMFRILGITPPRPERFVGLEEGQANKQLTQIADAPELLEYLRTQTKAQLKSAA